MYIGTYDISSTGNVDHEYHRSQSNPIFDQHEASYNYYYWPKGGPIESFSSSASKRTKPLTSSGGFPAAALLTQTYIQIY